MEESSISRRVSYRLAAPEAASPADRVDEAEEADEAKDDGYEPTLRLPAYKAKDGYEPTLRLPAASKPKIHLAFLDALRGLAAFYVAVGHAYVSVRDQLNLKTINPKVVTMLKMIDLGHFAVAVFIVLSGYCLMLPVARATGGFIPGGVGPFFKRRARRIIPPYMAALGLSLVLVIALAWFSDGKGGSGIPLSAQVSPGSILSHALLVHNLFPQWNQTINGPMWSVAMEFQIYFLFPLLLLPAWRKFGNTGALVCGFAVGLAPLLLPHGKNMEWTYPWYIGLFAVGMAGAVVSFSDSPSKRRLRDSMPWGVISVAMSLIVFFGLALFPHWCWRFVWLSDAIVGLATVSVIVYCTKKAGEQAGTKQKGLVGLLSVKPLVKLGAFSYSLYLIHMPILFMTGELLRSSIGYPNIRLIVQMFVMLPAATLAAYFFYQSFEKPFVGPAKARQKA